MIFAYVFYILMKLGPSEHSSKQQLITSNNLVIINTSLDCKNYDVF